MSRKNCAVIQELYPLTICFAVCPPACRGKLLFPFVAALLTLKRACQLTTIKQSAQIAQTAFGHNIDCFCCLLDRGRVIENAGALLSERNNFAVGKFIINFLEFLFADSFSAYCDAFKPFQLCDRSKIRNLVAGSPEFFQFGQRCERRNVCYPVIA